MDNSSTANIFLGAGLAFLASVLVELIKGFVRTTNANKDFRTILKYEFKSITSSIERLIEDYGIKQYFYLPFVDEISNKVGYIEKLKDKIIYIKEDTKKEEILSLLNEINLFVSDLKALESAAFQTDDATNLPTNWNLEVYKSKRQMSALKSVDLKRKIQELINYLGTK